MKILVATITFAITLGGLFLFEHYQAPPKEENYAQIVQGLVDQNQSKTAVSKSTNKSGITPVKTITPSAVQSFTPAPATTLPSASSAQATGSQQITPNSTSSPQTTPAPTPTSLPVSTPTPPPSLSPSPTPQESQQDYINIISLTSPIKQNSTAQLTIETLAQAQCLITVTLPSSSQSTAKGLETKTADSSGNITWSWKINWNTKPGTALIDLNCSKDSQSTSRSLQMTITE